MDILLLSLLAGNLSSDPYNNQVRLVQGGTGYASSGFVEVYLNGSWRSVCNMGPYDADSACRQLGYTSAFNYATVDG